MHLASIGHRLGETPQAEPSSINQIVNNAGGFVFPVNEWTRLDRFLIMGSTKSFYQSTQKLTKDNFDDLMKLIESNGSDVVDRIVQVSKLGQAAKQDYGIFALAACAGRGDLNTRKAALDAISLVCRTGSTLLHFISYIEQFRGWGRGLRQAIAKWYELQETDKLAYQLVKYQNRHGWTHRDALRLAHPKHSTLLQWAAKKPIEIEALPDIVQAYISAHASGSVVNWDALPKLTHEMIPTEWKTDRNVWNVLLETMPLTAMIRNLATMTRVGLLSPGSDPSKKVIERLSNQDYIKKSRVHPASILIALATYRNGKGNLGENTWIPNPDIVKALDGAFYLAFGNVQPSGMRTLIGLDVSGSMSSDMTVTPGLSAREATTAMSMIQVATEPYVKVCGFTAQGSQNAFVELPFAKGQMLLDAMHYVSRLPFGRTDCAIPMLYALQNRIEIDTFVIYTDNETWHGVIHPFEALRKYRSEMGIKAKLVVVGTTATNFSIADPSDAGMLDCAGFDANLPSIIADFSRA